MEPMSFLSPKAQGALVPSTFGIELIEVQVAKPHGGWGPGSLEPPLPNGDKPSQLFESDTMYAPNTNIIFYIF